MSFLKRAFERVEPGQQPTSAPQELQTWTKQTMSGLFGGFVFGAYRGLLQSRTSAASPIPANSNAHRTAMFIVRDGIFTGARIGLFVSMFSALAIAAHQMHDDGKEQPADYATAGAVTCGLFGGAMNGWRAALPGVIFGSVVSGMAAYAQETLKDVATDGDGMIHGDGNGSVSEENETEKRVGETVDMLIARFDVSQQTHPSGSIEVVDDVNTSGYLKGGGSAPLDK